jgi:tetratricopeptide (TPR) repeat protein
MRNVEKGAAVYTSAEAFEQAAALHKSGNVVDAEALLREALSLDPNNSVLWNTRGVMFAAMERYFDAVRCYREAISRDHASSAYWTNLGNALTHLKQPASAISCHGRAIARSPKPDALLYHNLGISLAQSGRHSDAIAAFSRALEIKPSHNIARWDRALSHLSLGDYRQGLADYEVRLMSGQLPVRELPGKRWAGQHFPGKRLLLVAEQGFGDTLWVARYLPQVKALGGELIVECQRELLLLLQTMRVADRLLPSGEALPSADLHCHLCSLPGLFTSDFASIPASPYLAAPEDRQSKFHALLACSDNSLRIGIVWSGSVTFQKNHERAQRLVRFMQAFNMPGVQLYSLQKGPPERGLATLPKGARIIDLAPLLSDFADTAAAIAQLDLVIMTDSAVAHLAGALGKPVWLLLSHVAHWLWLCERTDSPWYPSMRLFRPRAPGDWNHVFDVAALALMDLVDAKADQ